MRSFGFVLTIISAGLALGACGGDEEDAAVAASAAPPSASPPPAAPPPAGANQSPTISGAPSSAVMQGTQYTFTPSANDADGDVLTFSITGRPSWATFTATTGQLSGTPGQANIGMHSNITISVTDGEATASLATFGVNVVATAAGSATLSWTPPTQNTDGSPLSNLAGYKIYWGTSQGVYPNSVTINNPGLTTYMVEQLTPATWFFTTTSVTAQGVESAFSNVASKTVM
jgi:hypothetical protein